MVSRGASYLVQPIGPVVSRNSWKGRGTVEESTDIATSLALLFLSKGRWPVLMAKVQYRSRSPAPGKDTDWNRHRNDVNNLTIYVESQWKRELTWQTIDIRKASVDDLLQVPVLYFSGGGNPLPESEKDREKLAANLRDYIDRGGFIFADGEGYASEFDQGFRDLMKSAFPEPEYRFKPLDASHPIWIAEQKIPPDQAHLLLGIDYGCRTSVVYSPSNPPGDPEPSLACLWELSRGGQRAGYSAAVQEKIKGGLAIGINVLAYATNRELLRKDEKDEKPVPKVLADTIIRGKFAVAKLEHPGGCDAAPRALANLMEQAGHELNIRVETHPKLIGMQDPALFDYPVVFMQAATPSASPTASGRPCASMSSGAGCCLPMPSAAARPLANRSAARWASSFPRTPWRTSLPATRSGRTSTAVPISRGSSVATRKGRRASRRNPPCAASRPS